VIIMSDRIAELEAEVARLRAERDELASALRESKWLHSAVYSAPIGIFCIANGKYVFSNESHARFLGISRAELLAGDPSQRWIEVTHPEDFEREFREWTRMEEGASDGYQVEKRYIRKDGGVRWARTDAVAMRDAHGSVEARILYITDIHDKKIAAATRERLEAELRQAQKLEALGKLAGGVAHDFNNRLVIIMGYAALMQQNLPPGSPFAQHVEMVLESGQRATELTRQLLAYSRRQVLKFQAFDLNATVDGMRRMLERLIGDNIELVTLLGAEHPIFCDAGQIEQVILNLVINARDAMPNGGRLALETTDEVLREARGALAAAEYVVLTVSDAGTGISEDVLPHIFEPFFTTKEAGRGTGLGLATVEGIVRQSGGAVLVESQLNRGTTFRIFLPRARTSSAVCRPATHPSRPRLSLETLLVVDDDQGVRKLLVDLLSPRAHRILEACNGKDAIAVARQHPGSIHLLITDLVMPELGGIELAAELRRTDPSLRVLYLSGYADDAAWVEKMREPGTHFLPKPFLPGDLLLAVRQILEDTATATGEVSTALPLSR
jgi:two-component system cell cycle sensor histidine kinase/response regulator CckA